MLNSKTQKSVFYVFTLHKSITGLHKNTHKYALSSLNPGFPLLYGRSSLDIFHERNKVIYVSISLLSIFLHFVEIKKDWSDHALWWEQKQQWLLKPSWTLDKCGIHADARLYLTPQHKSLRLGMPNGNTFLIKACFSSSVFRTVMGICKLLSE